MSVVIFPSMPECPPLVSPCWLPARWYIYRQLIETNHDMYKSRYFKIATTHKTGMQSGLTIGVISVKHITVFKYRPSDIRSRFKDVIIMNTQTGFVCTLLFIRRTLAKCYSCIYLYVVHFFERKKNAFIFYSHVNLHAFMHLLKYQQ